MFLRKSIKVPLYVGRFDIVITDNVDDYEKVYNKFGKDEVFGHSIETSCKKSNYTHFVMVLNFNSNYKITHGIIAHEALHITSFILDRVGQEFDPNNHECFTYLIQWVTNEVYKFIYKNNIIVSFK